MGAFYATGNFGLEQDTAKAATWYQRAVDAGSVQALVGLAALYAAGDGVEADADYARILLDQADYLGLDVSDVRDMFGLE